MKKIFCVIATLILIMCQSVYASELQTEVKLPVIMYHHVSERRNMLNDYTISPEQLKADLLYLKENGYTTVISGDLYKWQNGGDLPEKCVMLTFDDGFESVYKIVYPILKEYSMRATVFIVGAITEEYTKMENHDFDCAYMDFSEISELDKSGVIDVQYHTYDMHRLSARRGCRQKSGESDSEYSSALKNDLEKFNMLFFECTEKTPTAAALPYGFYSESTKEILNSLGFGIIFTCEEHVNTLIKTEKFPLLGRFNRPNGRTSAEFFTMLK